MTLSKPEPFDVGLSELDARILHLWRFDFFGVCKFWQSVDVEREERERETERVREITSFSDATNSTSTHFYSNNFDALHNWYTWCIFKFVNKKLILYLLVNDCTVQRRVYNAQQYNSSLRYLSNYKSSMILYGSSTQLLILRRNVTASLPSMIRWSYVSATYIIGRIWAASLMTTLRLNMPCIPRIADWGGLIIGVPIRDPYTPIIHHTSYIIHHTSYIMQSYIIHHTSYIIHHT